jgi:hypothetical protein
MFRLIATVKRGIASNLAEVWTPYRTLDEARAAGASLSRYERVAHVLIASDDVVPPAFVEWVS